MTVRAEPDLEVKPTASPSAATPGLVWPSLLAGPRHLGVLNLLCLPMAVAGVARSGGDVRPVASGAAVLLGLLLAWAAVASAPPMPPAPARPYETPLDVCRPPFLTPAEG